MTKRIIPKKQVTAKPRQRSPVKTTFVKIRPDRELATKNYKKSKRYITPSRTQASPLVQFMLDNEHEKTTEEMIVEFRETCGHSFREIARRHEGFKIDIYQVCSICGAFGKGGKVVIEDDEADS